MKNESRAEILREFVYIWSTMPTMSKQQIAYTVVNKVHEMGCAELLSQHDIQFHSIDKARQNAQKIDRWLGTYDSQAAKESALFYLEHVIVAAMPSKLRMKYLQTVYSASNIVIGLMPEPTRYKRVDMSSASMSLSKESAEATHACNVYSLAPTKQNKSAAIKEIKEQLGAASAALEALQAGEQA